jgi:hypothetical protein
MYFDGSGKEDSDYITLAGCAADKDHWVSLEGSWESILEKHSVPYMHMQEAVSCSGVFDGWGFDRVEVLTAELMLVVSSLRDSMRVFVCTVCMADYRKWTSRLRMPPADRMCSRWTFDSAAMWYGGFPIPVLDKIDVIYDRNEPFLKHVYRDWKGPKKDRLRKPFWDLVNTVAPVDCRKTPALQLADMMAWSVNRSHAGPPNARIDELSSFIVNTPDALTAYINEGVLLRQYGRIHT